MIWYVPTRSGDFRLVAEGETCRLTALRLTAKESEVIQRFLTESAQRGWLETAPTAGAGAKVDLMLKASLLEAGPLLAAGAYEGDWHWNAVLSKHNRIILQEPGAAVGASSEAVVSVRPPKRGCPAPVRSNHRASEVLSAFCTSSQRRDFQMYGSLRCIGSHTGRAYRVYHRDAAARAGLSRSVVDVGTGEVVCAWDWRVPPEEEVLGLKLALEHAERWLKEGS